MPLIRRGFVDPECFWAVPLSLQYPHWEGMTIWQAIVQGTPLANAINNLTGQTSTPRRHFEKQTLISSWIHP
jgi:hypothetical protein